MPSSSMIKNLVMAKPGIAKRPPISKAVRGFYYVVITI